MVQDEGESELIGNEHLLKKLRELESIRALRGVSSRGVKDGGVGHPPRARVKEGHENTATDTMYRGAGYNAKKDFINSLGVKSVYIRTIFSLPNKNVSVTVVHLLA